MPLCSETLLAGAGRRSRNTQMRFRPISFPNGVFRFGGEHRDLALPHAKVLNQGCEIRQKGVLPTGQPLRVSCHLVGVREEEARVRIHQRLTTGTEAMPDLLVCDLFGVVVTGKGSGSSRKKAPEEQPWQPVGGWTASAMEGLSFAMLTGDFNPIHWVAPYARRFGFKNTILHGFASLSRSYESLLQHAPEPLDFIPRISVRFIRPLVLPNQLEVQVQLGTPNRVRLVDQAGAVCMAGDYSLSSSSAGAS